MDDPRTHVDIMRDLLGMVREHEWISVTHYCGRGCHCVRGYGVECPTCDGAEPNHKPGCPRAALILEVEAYLEVEEEIERRKEDGDEAASHHPA